MRRWVAVGMLVALAAATAAAQAPKGWLLRVDRSTNASDPDAAGNIRFTSSGTSFHAVNPQAAVYWNPANTATGAYTLKGTFTLNRLSGHTNYYGLVFGGSALEGAGQRYLYFMVAQDGTWLLKSRDGNSTPEIAGGPHPVVQRPDSTGRSTNTLEVRVAANKIDYVVNGTVVHSMPKSGSTTTDGIYGIRVNHQLDVTIDSFGKS